MSPALFITLKYLISKIEKQPSIHSQNGMFKIIKDVYDILIFIKMLT